MPLSFNPLHGVTLMLVQMQGRAEPLAEFLLNPTVRALRLDVEVDA